MVRLFRSLLASRRSRRPVRTAAWCRRLVLEPLESRDLLSYTVVDLGTLPRLPGSYAYGINQAGEVVGTSQNAAPFLSQAFVWQDENLTKLTSFGGWNSQGTAINDLGWAAGYGTSPDTGFHHAFLVRDGVAQDLGTLGGPASFATGLNNVGQVVGRSDASGGSQHAFLYQNDAMRDLGTLGGYYSYANAINDAGLVVGESATPDLVSHAFLYGNGRMTDLGSLDGGETAAYGINNTGQVVGWSHAGGFYYHAFVWDRVNGIQDLGQTGLFMSSKATAINNLGQIVGYETNYVWLQHVAYIWQDGSPLDLNGRLSNGDGWNLEEAHGINDAGQIVGWGTYNGETHAFLLNPDGDQALAAVGNFSGLLTPASTLAAGSQAPGAAGGSENGSLPAAAAAGAQTIGAAQTPAGVTPVSVQSLTALPADDATTLSGWVVGF